MVGSRVMVVEVSGGGGEGDENQDGGGWITE